MKWALALILALLPAYASAQSNLFAARNRLLQEHAALSQEMNALVVQRQQNAYVYNSAIQSGIAAQFPAQQQDLLRRIQAADARIAALRNRLGIVSANIQQINQAMARPSPVPQWRPPAGGGPPSRERPPPGCLLGQC